MQARKIRYDVIGLAEMRRRQPFNTVYDTGEELFFGTCDSRRVGVLVNTSANYGTALVVEYVNPVVQFLSNSVKASEKKFDMTDLELLCRLSEYSLDEAFARDIICTVLSHLEKKSPKESTLNKLLNVVASLIGKVADPSEFMSTADKLTKLNLVSSKLSNVV
ncbi:unnamed protein product [Angiostrongylus costaricensis]|uniref:DRIM domain-containing protein n=1 Tax=Angiostrongylus costaricensis TaxID=334426 RepID=A0A0R3PX42_ANGCS|nr:unnamed protein product [Angiostrongylus costaricensis]